MQKNIIPSVSDFLSKDYLESIGLVAAQWSSFEHAVLFFLARVSGNPLEKILIFVNNGSVSNWLEMLRAYVGKEDIQFNAIFNEAVSLNKERNNIVHSFGTVSAQKSISDSELTKSELSDSAIGYGLPKSKQKLISRFEYTVDSMSAIHARILDLEFALLKWDVEREKRSVGSN